ncbi:hypothetical protein CCX46_09075 [Pseudomonas sp. RU47]|uniref:hypothetical protein n=1 Tax=Pseudomonas sp. RU47 TaxID=2005388 RepID=UPI000FDE261B|nr:hypothetical protein [Pseudomonas sp. RU47]AZZ75295.1 hypothetical protein CCX46_09075 [Pseudomonas sp. RU47]
MLDKYDRWIHFYTASLETVPLGGPKFEMKEVFKKLGQKLKKGECYKLVDKGSACIRITKLKFNSNESSVALLLQYSDSKASDPSFGDLTSGKLRQEPKLAGEGIAVSAHMLIKLVSLPKKPLEFLLLLEDVPGIGKTRIIPFFNGMIKELMTRDFVDPTDGKTRPFFPIFVMEHHASQSLKEDLDSGQLRFIEMSKNETVSNMDEEPYLVRGTSSIKVKVVNNLDGADAVGVVNRLRAKYGKQGYEHFKVIFKHKEGKQRTVDVSGARQDAGEALFGKVEMITMTSALPQCSDKLNDEILRLMAHLKQ